MVTINPARLLGLPIEAGHETLRVGVAANVTAFRVGDDGWTITPARTIVAGRVVHDAGA